MSKGAYLGISNFEARALPATYTQLEYIQSNGTQYIDTGFVPNQDTRVCAQCALALASSTAGLFGVRESSSARAFQFVTQGNYYRSDYNGTLSNVTNNDYGTTMFYVDKNKNVTDIDGAYSSEAPYATFTCPGNLYVFATNNNGALYAYSSSKLYSMKIYDNGTLVRDFVPCKNASGVIGLYDLTNSTFYTNSGTGEFVAGPERGGLARTVKKIYVGVDGVARKVTKGYLGVDGTARTILSAGFCLGNLPVGTIVMLKENGTPKPFYLAKHDYEPGLNGSGRTLMVREHGYPDGANQHTMWHSKADGTGEGDFNNWSTNYGTSNLNRALTEYKNVFSAAMQEAIGSTTFYYTHSTSIKNSSGTVPDNNPYVTTLSRPVFQLSITEMFGEDFVARGENQAYCNVEGSILPIAETLRSIYNPSEDGGWVNGQILSRSVATYCNTSAVWGVTQQAVAFTMGPQKFAWARPSFTLPVTTGVDPEPNADGSYNLTLD